MASGSRSIKVISDLHIGIKGKKDDDFEFDETLFIRYLKNSLEEFDLLILNGDIFECWESGISANSILEQIRESRLDLFEFIIGTDRLILINGNHDAIIRTGKIETGAVSHYTEQFNDMVVYFAHGHQADFFNNGPGKNIGRCITCCVGRGERLIYKDLDLDLGRLDEICRANRDSTTTENHAFKIAAENGYDVVVYGHTHHPLVATKDSIIYANSGKGKNCRHSMDEVIVEITETELTVSSINRSIITNKILETHGTASKFCKV